nr:MAG TPA: hypothetical protein [Bacteriophage sp.]
MENVIELKFGDMRKAYNFEDWFLYKYKFFATEFAKYWHEEESYFKDPYQIVDYVEEHNIPVDFYYNFTDKYAKSYDDIREYLEFEGKFTRPL